MTMTIFEQKQCRDLAEKIADSVNIDKPTYDAFRTVSRSEFVPVSSKAFDLNPHLIVANQWISSPLTVAKMTMALELNGVDKVLEIGCGSGYQAAILSKIVRRVFSVERIEKLVKEAKEHFINLGITNVNVKFDDGNYGWQKYAPYERILLSAATDEINQNLFNQLENGGILVAPIQKKDKQVIVKFKKLNDGSITQKVIEECKFVPLLNGTE